MDVVQFFHIRTLQVKNGEWRWFFNFLKRHLLYTERLYYYYYYYKLSRLLFLIWCRHLSPILRNTLPTTNISSNLVTFSYLSYIFQKTLKNNPTRYYHVLFPTRYNMPHHLSWLDWLHTIVHTFVLVVLLYLFIVDKQKWQNTSARLLYYYC